MTRYNYTCVLYERVLTTPTDLLIGCLTLCHSTVIVVACCYLPGEALVDLDKPLRENTYVILNFSLLLLLLQNLLMELVTLCTQVLNA